MNKQAGRISAAIIFNGILLLLPLFMENRYFNIVEAKAHMFTLLCLIAWLLIVVSCLRTKGKCMCTEQLNGLDISMLCAGAAALVSCICSENFTMTFLGLSGWGIGGFLLLSFSAIYFFLSRNLEISLKSWIAPFAVACVIAYITVAQSMNHDILSMHLGIAEKQYYYFKSTLGNLNAHSGYVCLLLPAGLVIFANEKSEKRTAAEFVIMAAMLAETVFGCTDSVYLGIGLCSFIAIPYICADTQRMRRVCLLTAVFGALLIISGQCKCFYDSSSAIGGLAETMRSLPVSVPVTAVGLSGYTVLRIRPELFSKKVGRICAAILELLLILTAVYFLRDMLLNFSDKWGTNRGRTWRVSLESFAKLPLSKKIFGIGPEMQQYILVSEMSRKLPVYTCHSEPIQILMTMGIAGLATWFAVYFFAVYNMIRRRIWKSDAVFFALPIAAYLGQSLVNSAMATNVGIMCIFMAGFRKCCCANTKYCDTIVKNNN